MRRLLVLGAALVALALAGCGGGGRHAATGAAAGKGATLTDVHSAADFETLFNQASGEPRLVVLVSPT
ncbi:MAG TPA: hypothetical protein VHD91_01900 [Gaiellaceae bacterium]|nr:hypothetical protein [Gaiellaceae bacterium]